MTNAGDVDNPGGLGGLQLVQQEVGQQEVAQVVDLEHRLLPILGKGPLGGEHTGVVDQDVDLPLLPVDLPTELTDAGEGRQVTLLDFDVR